MARTRFILRYRGEGPAPEADVARVHALTDATVVGTSPRMLLVEADPEPLHGLVDALADWALAPEQQYAVPDTRAQVEAPPD